MRQTFLTVIGATGLLLAVGQASADPTPSTTPDVSQPAATSPATTTSTTASTNTSSTTDTADLDRTVCRTGPPPTGSRLGATRVCHTQREWDRMQAEQQQELSRQQISRGNAGGN